MRAAVTCAKNASPSAPVRLVRGRGRVWSEGEGEGLGSGPDVLGDGSGGLV